MKGGIFVRVMKRKHQVSCAECLGGPMLNKWNRGVTKAEIITEEPEVKVIGDEGMPFGVTPCITKH